MELSLEDRKQPGHLDYEHSGDPLMKEVQDAFEALELKLKATGKNGNPAIMRKVERLRSIKRVAEQNLHVPMDNGKVKINIVALIEEIKALTESL